MESLNAVLKHSCVNMNLLVGLFQSKHRTFDTKKEALNPNQVALKEALYRCRREIKKSKRWKVLPSPICFEHAAMLSRQNKNYQAEMKICQLYIALVDKCISRRRFNKKRFERKARSLCESFTTRMQNIDNLNTTEGVDVQHM